MDRSLVLVATYNERANTERLCREILGLNRALDVLFVDDNSPDGTGELLDGLARELPGRSRAAPVRQAGSRQRACARPAVGL